MHNMKLNQCIYCNSNDDLTVEHIIPSSISKKVGEQLVIFCVCRKCNSKLGDYVDGPFINSKKDLSLLFRGSSNQRLIDVQQSLQQNKVVLWIPNIGVE